ncbi:hypothetical protein MTO96_026330 [Rhipicephalus appendiculatus]
MALAKMFAAVAFLASACRAMVYRTDSACDFTDVAIDGEIFSRLIARLPESIESGPQGYHTLLPGLEVGGLTAKGLNKLRPCGPVIPYCTNGTRMVQVDFYEDGDTHFLSPWKVCTGDEGRIMIRAMFTRSTFQFRIVESTAAGVKLEFDRLLPVTTQGVQIFVQGAEVWKKEFFRSVHKAFRMINE